MGKISPELERQLAASAPDEPVDVILEMDEASGDYDTPDQLRRSFAAVSGPVKSRIRSLGGDVAGEAWINGTLHAKLNRHAVESLKNEGSVVRFDVPRVLERE